MDLPETENAMSPLKETEYFRTLFMPYCLQKQADGKWVVLNRNYKPLGMWPAKGAGHIKYDDYSVEMPLTDKRAALLSWNGRRPDDKGCVWLYNDGCIPTAAPEHMKA